MHPRTTVPPLAILIATVCALPCPAVQLARPRLDALFPAGGAAGTTVDVRIQGAELEGADSLVIGHPGFRSFRRKEPNQFRVAIGPDVPPGPYEIRVSSPLGLSQSRIFVVGDRPETVEVEPNDRIEQATTIQLNSVVEGVIQASPDVDWYRLPGKQGRRLVIALEARRIDSPLDGTLRLFRPDGKLIAESRQSGDVSPSLEAVLPVDGDYRIKVHDTTFAGGPAHVYRLIVHDGPRVLAFRPPIGSAPAFLHGTGLGPGSTPSPFQLDGRPLEQLAWTEPLGEPTWVGRRNRLDSRLAGLFGWEWSRPGVDTFPTPLLVPSAIDPVVPEAEPNGPDRPQGVDLPVRIAGGFQSSGDRDVYRFHSRAGQAWWFEVWAERLGNPVDASIVIQKVGDDGKTQDLANADDTPDPDGAAGRFPAQTVDPRIRWVTPGDGTYQVVVSDLYGAHGNDVRMAYQLQIRPDRPDFRLFVVADSAAPPTVRAGGRATARAVIRRIDGFARPVRIEPTELPTGLSMDPVVIGPTQSTAPLVFSAEPGATNLDGRVQLLGRSLSSSRKEVLADGQKPVEERVRGVESGQVFPAAAANQPARGRLTSEFAVAIRESAPFRLEASPAEIWASAGESVPITVRVHRFEGFNDAVALSAADLPAKVTVANATIAPGADSATLTIQVAADAPAGLAGLVIRGHGKFPFHVDRDAKTKPSVPVDEPSNAVLLNIRR